MEQEEIIRIYQKKQQEIEEYEKEHRKNMETCEETECEVRKLLFHAQTSVELLYQQWGACGEIYRLQELVQEFERQALIEREQKQEELDLHYRKIKTMEEEAEELLNRK